MCLIVFDWQPDAPQWLRLSGNRDEFYQRPTAPLHLWPDDPLRSEKLWAGKDLKEGGTWMGVTESGRWAALTNVRVLNAGPDNPRSRGELVLDYLNSGKAPQEWLTSINPSLYAPFNLLVGTTNNLWYLRNHPEVHAQPLAPGLYSLSNAQLNSRWPKAELAEEQLAQTDAEADSDVLSRILNRRALWPDDKLPDTGVPLAWERLLSAQFIMAPGYGTRSSTGIVGETIQDDSDAGQPSIKKRIGIQEVTWNEAGEAVNTESFRIVLKDR